MNWVLRNSLWTSYFFFLILHVTANEISIWMPARIAIAFQWSDILQFL